MDYTMEDKYRLIKEECLKAQGTNPIEIVKSVMHKDFISMHGPEHHLLDGAAFLAAYKNAGGDINLEEAIDALAKRSAAMPGAICGYWGICGSSASLGAALSVIHHTGPLSSDEYYKDHMEFTSRVLSKMAKIGGPRCCKRNAFISITTAVDFVKEKYGIQMEMKPFKCEFSPKNPQCIKQRCPFYSQDK